MTEKFTNRTTRAQPPYHNQLTYHMVNYYWHDYCLVIYVSQTERDDMQKYLFTTVAAVAIAAAAAIAPANAQPFLIGPSAGFSASVGTPAPAGHTVGLEGPLGAVGGL